MEIQHGDITGGLYYDNSVRKYVKPPTNERRHLALKKENDYLIARKGKNVLESTLKNLPYLEKDKDVYNKLKDKTNIFINSLENVDNLEDNLLDVDQFSHDFINKYGGKELIESTKRVKNELKVLDEAYENDEIVDINLLNWHKKKILDGYTGIKKDKLTGNYLKGKVPSASYSKYVNIPKNLDTLMKGWKENGFYSEIKDANGNNTGRIKVNKQVPGYLNYTTGTEIPLEELYSSALAYVKSQPEADNYLRELADFKSSNIKPTAENLYKILKPSINKKLFGVKDPSINEIQEEIDKGTLNPKTVLKNALYTEQLLNTIELPVQKYSYINVKPNLIEDKVLMSNIKMVNDLKKERRKKLDSKKQSESNADVSIHKFTTVQKLNPLEINELKTTKATLKNERIDLQGKINRYTKALNTNDKSVHPDQLRRYEKEIRVLDEHIENIERKEDNIKSSVFKKIKDAGFDTETVYNELLPEAKIVNRESNGIRALRTGVDITDYAEINENGDVLIDGEKVPNWAIKKENIKGEERYIVSRGSDRSPRQLGEIKDFNMILDKILNENGEVNSNFKGVVLTKDGFVTTDYTDKGFTKLANKEELEYIMSDIYLKLKENGDTSAFNFMRSEQYTNDKRVNFDIKNIYKYVEKANKNDNKIDDIDITKDMSYLIVQGDTTKDSLRAYNNYEKTLKEAFITTPEAYKIGDISLPQYLSEKYDIDNLYKYIDWNKSKIKPLLERDRSKGQLYGLNLIPTKEGAKISEVEDAFINTNSLKLVASYHGSDQRVQDNHIQDILLKSFSDLQYNLDAEYNLDVLEEAGRMYINTDPAGKALDDLNLYVLNTGGEANWNVEGQNIKIKAIERDVRSNDLMDSDFVTETTVNGENQVMAYNSEGVPGWINKQEFDNDINNSKLNPDYKRKYKQVIFGSPSDIKKVFGATLLNKRYKERINNYNKDLSNVDYYKNSYNLVSPNDIKINNYSNNSINLKNTYNSFNDVNLIDNKGNSVYFESRVKADDLVDLRTDFKDNIAKDNRLPYVNKNAYPYVKKLIKDYDLLMTGGFRGEDTHEGLKGSIKGSSHKYGFGLDARENKEGLNMFNTLKSNPNLLANYNIIRLLKHNKHLHIEFGDSSL